MKLQDIVIPNCGVELIKRFESFSPNAYPDPLTKREPITIGWGSTKKRDGSTWHLGESISQQEADELLIYQLEKHYLPDLAKIPCWGELNPNQQGALLSFGYNLGSKFYGAPSFDSITKVLNNRDWAKIRETFIKYRNPGTNVEKGLLARRQAEAELFLTPYR
ncbi:MAG TPA: lysozyme [Allocoleopsis sp.]